MSRLNPVDPAFTITTIASSAQSGAFAHKTDAIRLVAIGVAYFRRTQDCWGWTALRRQA